MIISKSNSKVKRIIQLQKKTRQRQDEQVFIIEGIRFFFDVPIRMIQEIYVAEDLLHRLKGEDGEASPLYGKVMEKLEAFSYELVSDEVFQKMSDTVSPQGILCVVKRPQYTLWELLDKINPLFLLIENLQDPGNLGTIIRTAEAAGAAGIIMSKETVDIYNPKTLRATMGSVFRMPFIYTENLGEVIEQMKQKGISIYAAHLKGTKDYDEYSYEAPCGFLIGNEGSGLSDAITKKATDLVKIPMQGEVESLNAAIAAAVVMYEASRQRK